MEERLYKIIEIVSIYMKNNHSNLYFDRKTEFIGFKYNENDKYYLFFVSKKYNHICLTIRKDITLIENEVVYIDDLPDYKILAKIETFLYKKENNMPIYISHEISNNSIDNETLYDKITELEKTINKEEINIQYGNITIDKVSMSVRLYNGCIRNNIKTVADFLNTPILDFLKLRWLGRKTLKEVANIKKRYFNGTIKEITYEKTELNQIYYNLDKLDIKKDITEEEYEKYIDFGIQVGIIVNEIIISFYNKRNIDIFKLRMNFIDLDKHTLDDIATMYNLTRERIRQILSKMERKISTLKYKCKIIEIFNSISKEEDLLNYLIIGIYGLYNEEFLKFIMHVLNYDESQQILKVLKQILQSEEENNLYQNSIEDKILKVTNYGNYLNPVADIIFAGLNKERNTNNCNNNGVKKLEKVGTEVEYESNLEKRMLMRLQRCQFIKNIKTQSLIIKYDYNGKIYSYYPDFQILTKDNKLIVIEIKPEYNMMDKYVMIKYNALKKYCIKNGFGYLMIDDRYNTYEKIKESPIDKNIEAQFLEMVKSKKKLSYPECKLFMVKHNIHMIEIATIVINNYKTIECTTKPFQIKLK